MENPKSWILWQQRHQNAKDTDHVASDKTNV